MPVHRRALPRPRLPLLDISHAKLTRAVLAYGADPADPLAWQTRSRGLGRAAPADVAGLPPVVLRVNECDALRDEGAALHGTLAAAGVDARLRVAAGASHAAERMLSACPRFARDALADLAAFASERHAASTLPPASAAPPPPPAAAGRR